MNPRQIPELHELRMNRLQAREDAIEAVLEAERERGAEIAVAELIAAARRTAEALKNEPEADRAWLFVARFCGSIQPGFLDLAKEIAAAAGMGHLYTDSH
ncbi:hypothetical protein [Burkholderia multivorans]|uniref:hypothetical protein n=1 Tax=Burkholderia multivorans TaxID=87883 RepID=UPI0021C23A25|nr:hypothetical protein [Burkholderia multivorans]MDR9052101.1 hypothetical protein [Burkholderia multivorans]MDR9060488.1 hypothetical protein [Burkholderia multivorans]MDR9066400.1 hypothetical protein [Burkholderia multivorans]MDR9072356.1 hypothetical protein [Burkholderia multivorans]MDR9078344.1 hypothetical protein [Burkholderia multivorans]